MRIWKKLVFVVALMLVAGSVFAGCNTLRGTTEGVGRDIEETGEAVQNIAN